MSKLNSDVLNTADFSRLSGGKKMNLIKVVPCTLVLALSLSSGALETHQNNAMQALNVFKTPTCGCCKKWVSHIEQAGIPVQSKYLPHLEGIKSKYGIKSNYRSCHTAVTQDGFIFVGHIPAKLIKQFLSKPPANALGLSVPAMPIGSPGMEVEGRFMPYQVLILYKDGSHGVHARINKYKEQF